MATRMLVAHFVTALRDRLQDQETGRLFEPLVRTSAVHPEGDPS